MHKSSQQTEQSYSFVKLKGSREGFVATEFNNDVNSLRNSISLCDQKSFQISVDRIVTINV